MSKPANRIETPPPSVKTTDGQKNSTVEITKTAAPTIKKSVLRDYFESFVVTLIMAFFGMTFIVQAVTVPTGSMQNTINIGDHFLVNKFIYAPGPALPFLPMRDVKRGDIVVFKYPGNKVNPSSDRRRNPPIIPYQTNYIKRVIGLPGDTVEFRNNQVFVNGKLLPERRVIGDVDAPPDSNPEKVPLKIREFETAPPEATYTVYYSGETMEAAQKNDLPLYGGYNFGVAGKPSVVPPNEYFMMGDARDNSEDSRFWGFVPRELIVGRAMFIYWSCDQSKGTGFLDCLTHPRFERIGKLIK